VRCKNCHYSLENLTGPPHRCPECGRAFDPRDTSSFLTQRQVELEELVGEDRWFWVVVLVIVIGMALAFVLYLIRHR
jgi:hypothetical protein